MGAPSSAHARALPRPAGALGDGSRGRPLRDRGRRAAIADLRLGRIDEETTANVGLIDGGSARNIVPEWCTLEAEARSHDARKLADLVQEMLDTFAFAASTAECTLETEVSETYQGYRFRDSDPIVQLARTALERCGYELVPTLTGGGADANVFNAKGLPCLNLANGMMEIHTADEHIAAADLDAMVEVTLALVDAARLDAGRHRDRGARGGPRPPRGGRDRLHRLSTPDGDVEVGDDVVVNEQARLLELGSGGFDVLYVNLTRGLGLSAEEGAHVVALPYTPGQVTVCYKEESETSRRRSGLPVVLCTVHSQVARSAPGSRVCASRTSRSPVARCRCRSRTRFGSCATAASSSLRAPSRRASTATRSSCRGRRLRVGEGAGLRRGRLLGRSRHRRDGISARPRRARARRRRQRGDRARRPARPRRPYL